MNGIVLWCGTDNRHAVIWCEDHGDLAYFRGDCATAMESLEAGDWVRFDVTVAGQMRIATEVEVMDLAKVSGLPATLNDAADMAMPCAPWPIDPTGADIVPFRTTRHSQTPEIKGDQANSA
ncbi:hypothetical protein ACFORG_15065 [Lutimaribacter marinistellae]|uniref:Uncharacterized protein n=1 Tax=Lutimaribacter marinistellae TaxID=1820329 RepID=A0ABV7THK7_9RHOB